MRVVVFAKATEDTENGVPPSPEAFEAMEKFNEALVEAGILVAGAGLKPSSQAARIVFDGDEHTVIDGPFPETKELIAGFSIWEVKDMAEAIAWARRAPSPTAGSGQIEIRPFYEMADMVELLSPATREKLGVA